MSYNPFLDAVFSHWYLNLGLLCLLGGIAYLIYWKFVPKKKWKWAYGGGCVVFAFVWLMTQSLWNAEYLGLGSPDGIDGMVLAGDRLYVVDYMLGGGGEAMDPDPFSRIHVLNAGTGEKILRFPAGDHAELMGVQGDSLIVHFYLKTKIFSAKTGHCIVTWNSETLPETFPELAVGIDNTMISRANKSLELTTLDGNHWNLSLATGKLSQVDPATQHQYSFSPSNERFISNSDEIRVNDQPGGRRLLHLDGIGGIQEISYLKDNRDSIPNRELKFIRGKIMALNESPDCIVILSFETTKKTGFILTGVTLDGSTKLWELKQRGLRPQDDFTQELTYTWDVDRSAGVLYLGVHDEVIALKAATGEILWRQEL